MKKYLLIISLLFLIFSSCEEPDDNTNIYMNPNISENYNKINNLLSNSIFSVLGKNKLLKKYANLIADKGINI